MTVRARPDPHPSNPQGSTSMRPVKGRAKVFSGVREAHRSEIVEDYVELIAELIGQNGEARPVDIARRMGVKQPTVAKNLARLKREGLIVHERYRSIFLTEAGRALAETCRHRHQVVVDLLVRLGLDRETAELDAEGLEHHVSDRTMAVFKKFLATD